MTDRNRNQNQPNQEQPPRRQGSRVPSPPDDASNDEVRTSERERPMRDRRSVTDDRGPDADRDRRSLSGGRERSSEMEQEPSIEDDVEDERNR